MSKAEARSWELIKSLVLGLSLAYVASLDRRLGVVEAFIMGGSKTAAAQAAPAQLPAIAQVSRGG